MNTELLWNQPEVYEFYNIPIIKRRLDSADPVRGAFENAYFDCQRTLRGMGKNPHRKEIKEFIYTVVTEFYYNMIHVRKDFPREAFDVSLVDSCYKIINGVKEYGYDVSLGQAQKIINMFFKYVLITDERVNDIISYLHVPLDGVILRGIAGSEEFGSLCDTARSLMPWSKFNDEEKYMELQNGLAYMFGNRILWEFVAWKSWK
ncbi:MAG: hypothetical protein ACI4MH_00600 [Candidatus Coproplasma sp.]